MLEGFKRSEIKTSGARIVTVTGGKGPPLLLMHGNPFNHLSWQKIAPRLATEFTVVATDLRGYGDSEKPPGGPGHINYSFRAMAQDQVEVMAALGFDRFYAAGHDRGARVLHRMCLDHPQKVARAAIIDIVPQHYLYANITKAWATFSWHWFFNIQPYDLPEKMMGADPDWFIKKKLAKTEQGLSFFDPAALADFMRCFRNPETIHAICEDYRAGAGDRPRNGRGRRQGRAQDRLPAAAAVGRDRRGRAQPEIDGDLAALCLRHPGRQGAAERALRQRGGARGNLYGAARVLPGRRAANRCAARAAALATACEIC